MGNETTWRRMSSLTSGLVALGWATPAFAHAADRGFVLLLPTGYYMLGGAAAVAASFVILALLPPAPLERLATWRLTLGRLGMGGRAWTSMASFLVVCALLCAGVAGSRDPLSNPLPLMFWTVWWVGLTLLVAVAGNAWRWLEPWYGPWRLAQALMRHGEGAAPPAALPKRLGYWPAIALFAGFAWFELVYPAPDDPYRLAIVLACYWLFNFAGMMLFGHRAWTERVECFSVFFAMIAKMAVVGRGSAAQAAPPPPPDPLPGQPAYDPSTTLRVPPLLHSAGEEPALALRLPGAGAADAPPLPASGVLFLLLALSTVSYDGLMRTFFWLDAIGVNPLEFPGRSALIVPNTLGLLAAFAALAALFYGAVALGEKLVPGGPGAARAAGALVWSILPISLAYHFSHYLVALVLNGQYALAAISDPLSRGWNLFGTAGYHVLAGATSGAESAWVVWNLQAAAIVGGHVLAVAIAHVIAYRLHGDARRAAESQMPLALLMIGYTIFGLWLLSSPTGY